MRTTPVTHPGRGISAQKRRVRGLPSTSDTLTVMRRAVILSIGTELTLGQSIDTNSAWLAAQLAAIGIRTIRHITVPDELPDIANGLGRAVREAEIVLVTGGLGATADDLTRDAMAQVAGVRLVEDPRVLEQVRGFFTRRGRSMPDKNRVQALVPVGGESIENPRGTAPGLALPIGSSSVFAMPGVPSEMRAMFPAIAARLAEGAAGAVIRGRILHCIGLSETELGERIADLMQRGRNPEVGTTANLGIIGIRVNASAESPTAADALLNAAELELRSRLGTLVFGRDGETLSGAVGELLARRGETVGTAESCTGGMIAAALTDTPGSSRYVRGAIVAYSNEIKRGVLGVLPKILDEHGAVSAGTAEAMAIGGRDRLGATYCLSATGIAGPDGGTHNKPIGLVYIGLAGPDGAIAREFQFGADASRDHIRARTVLTALNLLRRRLLD